MRQNTNIGSDMMLRGNAERSSFRNPRSIDPMRTENR